MLFSMIPGRMAKRNKFTSTQEMQVKWGVSLCIIHILESFRRHGVFGRMFTHCLHSAFFFFTLNLQRTFFELEYRIVISCFAFETEGLDFSQDVRSLVSFKSLQNRKIYFYYKIFSWSHWTYCFCLSEWWIVHFDNTLSLPNSTAFSVFL